MTQDVSRQTNHTQNKLVQQSSYLLSTLRVLSVVHLPAHCTLQMLLKGSILRGVHQLPIHRKTTKLEIASTADNSETMMNSSQPHSNLFFQPSSLGALPHLWLQAKLTISLSPVLDGLARIFITIAAELWVGGRIDTVNAVFANVARHFTLSSTYLQCCGFFHTWVLFCCVCCFCGCFVAGLLCPRCPLCWLLSHASVRRLAGCISSSCFLFSLVSFCLGLLVCCLLVPFSWFPLCLAAVLCVFCCWLTLPVFPPSCILLPLLSAFAVPRCLLVLLVLIQCTVVGRSHGLGCTGASMSGDPDLLSVGQSGAPPVQQRLLTYVKVW